MLREVTGSDEAIENVMTHLRDVGYVNYFGLQRFGTGSVGTHLVGVELVKGNWEVRQLRRQRSVIPHFLFSFPRLRAKRSSHPGTLSRQSV